MALTTKQITDLNDSMSAMQNAQVGNLLDMVRGIYTATSDDATANEKSITTGKTTATAFIVQIYRSGVDVTADAIITLTSGVLKVADGGATYVLTAGDKITYFVF